MDLQNLQKNLDRMFGVRAVCVGDVMVDRFIYGDVSRVSAEAPIPVLAKSHETTMLGGAGNVARNVAALGGVAALIGVIGDDAASHEALALIGDEAGVEGFLISDPDRATTVKSRFVSSGQQLLRLDAETIVPVSGAVEARLVRTILDAAVGAKAILLSDYGKGVVTPAVIEACRVAAKREGAALIVDSKSRGFAHYGDVDIVKPNAGELARATDLPTDTDEEIEAALAAALSASRCDAILVTRAAKGMSLARRGGSVRHFRRPPPEVFDTAGAGDTALATVGLALAAGASDEEAIELALLACGVVVEKAGVATASPDDLIEAELAAHRAPIEGKIASGARMVMEAARWRERGLKVGFTNGCFDILHPGHIAYLAEAKSWCDRLIVALNTDASVRGAKGPDRPINGLEARALVLGALSSVDLVVPFDEETPEALIRAARPDLLVKGGDYQVETVVGADIVRSWGGEVRLAAFLEGHSTTATLRRAAGRS